ncbi:rhodopsin-like [Daktulosphaira vitifoliae]|uniref:rhodopsin-like n=1 Tax=Daktulosphaira vitifoliae TaxID=58002 RepID=UPI0021AA55E4|nr:rhodopsin-like [Daktulosphaira vitifoliae]
MRQQLISNAAYHGAAVVLGVIGIVGFVFNACVIFIMIKDPQLRTPQNLILFNLAVSDFAVSLVGNPVTLAAAITKGWIFGQTICVMYGFFMGLFGISSITTLSVLAYDRYLMIRYPFSTRRLTNESAIYAIASIWVYAFIVTGPPLFGWSHYVNESADISCSVDWESGEYVSYVVFIFLFGFFIPVSIIFYSYINLFITVKRRASTNSFGQATKAEFRVAIMVVVMIIAFLISWTPYAVLALLIAFAGVQVSPIVSIILAIFAKSSICWNPIIYIGLNTQFRTAWKRFLKISNQMEGSKEGENFTRVSKMIVGKVDSVPSPNSTVEQYDTSPAITHWMAIDERENDSTGPYMFNLEMCNICKNKVLDITRPCDIGDVSL